MKHDYWIAHRDVEHVTTISAVPPRDNIRRHGLVGMPHVGVAVCVVDRRSDVEPN